MTESNHRINFSIEFAKQLAQEHDVPLQICVRALKGAEGDQLVVEGYLHAAMQEIDEVDDREAWNWEEAKRYKQERLEISAQNKPKRQQPKPPVAEETLNADSEKDTVS